MRNSRARARLRQQTFPLGAKRASPGGFLCHGNEVSYDTKKQKSPDLATSASHVYLRHPYVGIIQIRLSVEGHTFLSACHTSSRLFYCRILSYLVFSKKARKIENLSNYSNCRIFPTVRLFQLSNFSNCAVAIRQMDFIFHHSPMPRPRVPPPCRPPPPW